MKRISKLIAKRLRPSLARFPKTPEKSFERKASRNNCAMDSSPPEKSCDVNGRISTRSYQKNIVNRPPDSRLSMVVQSCLGSLSVHRREMYLWDVFNKGTQKLDIAQCVADVDPFKCLSFRCCHDATQDSYSETTAQNDPPSGSTRNLSSRPRITPTVYLSEG